MESKIKHLEFIQNIITRLSTHSFTLKGLCISIIAAIVAFDSDTASTSKLLLVLILPVFSFWALDSYFLQLERKYRLLYDYVRLLSEDAIDFSLDISQVSPCPKYGECLFSKSELCYYGSLLAFIAVICVAYYIFW